MKYLPIILIIKLISLTELFSQINMFEQHSEAILNGILLNTAYITQYGELNTNELAIVDIDGDLDLDLYNHLKNELYRNIGTVQKPFWQLENNFLSINFVANAYAATFCDIDNDGDQDLFFGDFFGGGHNGYVYLYPNIGSNIMPLFSPDPDTLKYFSSTLGEVYIDGYDSAAPSFSDQDNDGDFDLFLGSGPGTIGYFENIGTSTKPIWDSISMDYLNFDVGYKARQILVDLDNDGDNDLICGNDTRRMFYFKNNSNSDTVAFELITENFAGIQSGNGSDYTAPFFGDIDGDGDLDFFAKLPDGYYSFYRNIGDKNQFIWKYESPHILKLFTNTTKAYPQIKDINNDLNMDLILGGTYRTFLYQNIGSPDNPQWKFISDDFLNGIDKITPHSYRYFCDLDDDKDLDLCLKDYDELIFIKNIGTVSSPIFDSVPNFKLDFEIQDIPVFADIEGSDNDLDLVVLHMSEIGLPDSIYYYINNGGANTNSWDLSTKHHLITIDEDEYWTGNFQFADYDQDGDLDLFASHVFKISLYENIGSPSAPQFQIGNPIFLDLEYNHSYPYLDIVDIDNQCGLDFFLGAPYGTMLYTNIGIKPEIEPLDSTAICQNSIVKPLSGSPLGGSWSGAVNSAGLIEPYNLAQGLHSAIYSFDYFGCLQSDSISFEIINCISVNIKETDEMDISIYPIPFQETLQLNINNSNSEFLSIDIFDLKGIHQINLFNGKPTNPLNLNWNRRDKSQNWLSSGIYLMRILSEAGSITKKIILL